MTRTIKSETNDKRYTLTIDEGYATNCSCPDRFYRKHTCKHMAHFDEQMRKIAVFAVLFTRFDVRSQAVIEAKRANYWNYEMSLAS